MNGKFAELSTSIVSFSRIKALLCGIIQAMLASTVLFLRVLLKCSFPYLPIQIILWVTSMYYSFRYISVSPSLVSIVTSTSFADNIVHSTSLWTSCILVTTDFKSISADIAVSLTSPPCE